jgi:hypothetical protein
MTDTEQLHEPDPGYRQHYGEYAPDWIPRPDAVSDEAWGRYAAARPGSPGHRAAYSDMHREAGGRDFPGPDPGRSYGLDHGFAADPAPRSREVIAHTPEPDDALPRNDRWPLPRDLDWARSQVDSRVWPDAVLAAVSEGRMHAEPGTPLGDFAAAHGVTSPARPAPELTRDQARLAEWTARAGRHIAEREAGQ